MREDCAEWLSHFSPKPGEAGWLHRRFGRNALTIGIAPTDLGTKIAFTRVPDASEFEE